MDEHRGQGPERRPFFSRHAEWRHAVASSGIQVVVDADDKDEEDDDGEDYEAIRARCCT